MNFRENPMNISVPKRKWATATHMRNCERLAKHVMSHYPKDSTLHKAVRDSFKSMNDAATKLEKSSRKAAPKRARKSTTRRRRTTARKAAPRKRTTVRRRTAKRRAPASRRTTARRRPMRRRKSA